MDKTPGYMDIFYQATICRWTMLEVHTHGYFDIQILVSFFQNLQGLPPVDLCTFKQLLS